MVQSDKVMTGKKLTRRQRALVDTLATQGCTIMKAAELAGYSMGCGGNSGRVTAQKTLQLPHVQQYMRSVVSSSISGAAPLALDRMLLLGAKSEHVQLDAAKQIMDRAGYMVDKGVSSIQYATAVNIMIDLD